jgi:hypothetical protein
VTPYLKAIVGVSLVVFVLQVSGLAADQSKALPAAPVPPQILAAKKVFIANAGGDDRWYENPIFNGGPLRAYNEFYAAVKTAGRYEIVGSPADAELILEIGLTVTEVSGGGGGKGAYWYDPQLRLAIRDPKTNVLLWAFTEHVQWAILRENRQKNFDQTMAKIISDLQDLSAPSNNAQRP